MSKAVLVMDMPDKCLHCKLQDFATCRITKKCHTGDNRPSDCPLRPLPKKQKLTFIEPGQDAITLGWNACIEAIEENAT